MGTRHQPHGARSCELGSYAAGAARGRPGGAPLAWVWGVRGRALSQARQPVIWGMLSTGCGCGGCGREDLSPTPQRALLRPGFARWGAARRRPGGAPFAWVWGVRGRALLHPCQPPVLWGRTPGPTTQWLWVWGVQVWGPVTKPTARVSTRWLCALWGQHEGAGRGRLFPGCGGSGSGALPSPTARPFGRAARAHYPLAVGVAGMGVGTRHQPHSARSCELALRAVGAARGCQGKAPLAWVCRVRGRALSHP